MGALGRLSEYRVGQFIEWSWIGKSHTKDRMIDSSDFYVYLLTSVVVVLMPGPGMLFVISRGISNGTKAGMIATLGTTGGISLHIIAAVLGVSVILHSSVVVFQVVKFAGVGYLLYLAWRSFRGQEEFRLDPNRSHGGLKTTFWQGFLVNALNPKLSLFFLAFLPQFVEVKDKGTSVQTMLLGVIFMGLTGVIFAGYGYFAATLRQYMLNSHWVARLIRWMFGSIFVGLGVRLALADR